jgi:uncharacterized protein with HEPN domain
MKESCSDALADILNNARYAREFLADVSFAAFEADIKLQYAVIRALEICGEAAKRIPEPVRILYPGIEWRALAGMRDRLIHGYDVVNPGIIWKTVKDDLPGVVAALEKGTPPE